MAGDESESAGNIIARAFMEREQALARASIGRSTGAAMAWQPPSEDEFDRAWITPAAALEAAREDGEADAETWKRDAIERLKAGLVIAVARHGKADAQASSVRPMCKIEPALWQLFRSADHDLFWRQGTALFAVPRPAERAKFLPAFDVQRYFDVRLDPVSFSETVLTKIQSAGSAAPSPPEGLAAKEAEQRRSGRPLAEAEMRRFVGLYLQIWANDSVEGKAGRVPSDGVARR